MKVTMMRCLGVNSSLLKFWRFLKIHSPTVKKAYHLCGRPFYFYITITELLIHEKKPHRGGLTLLCKCLFPAFREDNV